MRDRNGRQLELLPHKGDWAQTYTGKAFYPEDPRPEDIDINDIAHALSLMCRFNGHCTEFYSVAEHSVRVSKYMQNRYAKYHMEMPSPDMCSIYGLMHDSTEAYISDVIRPIKKNIKEFKNLEDIIYIVILKKFKLSIDYKNIAYFNGFNTRERYFPIRQFIPVDKAVKVADDILLATEKRDLMKREPQSWKLKASPLMERIVPYTSKDAERLFLDEFYRLYEGMKK